MTLVAVQPDHEFAYTPADFKRVRKLIYARAGIALADSKSHMVYSRLARRLRALGLHSFREYLDRLEHGGDAREWQAFTNALTTNLTAFFREPHHFDALRHYLKSRPAGERVWLWSAAASTGEEAYSMAIAAAEAYGTLSPPVSILATDIDTAVLETGRSGVYPIERLERMDGSRRRQFFRRGVGDNAGRCRVVDELRQLVEFRQLNLLAPRYPLRERFGAIFCRNVLIYFDKQTQERVLRQLLALLAPGGLLFTGHSESFPQLPHLLQACGRTIYRPVAAAVAA